MTAVEARMGESLKAFISYKRYTSKGIKVYTLKGIHQNQNILGCAVRMIRIEHQYNVNRNTHLERDIQYKYDRALTQRRSGFQ